MVCPVTYSAFQAPLVTVHRVAKGGKVVLRGWVPGFWALGQCASRLRDSDAFGMLLEPVDSGHLVGKRQLSGDVAIPLKELPPEVAGRSSVRALVALVFHTPRKPGTRGWAGQLWGSSQSEDNDKTWNEKQQGDGF